MERIGGNEKSMLHSLISEGFAVQKSTFCELSGRTNSKLQLLNHPLNHGKLRHTFPNLCSCMASNLNVVRYVFSEGHVEYNQGFARHGCVGEGVTTAIWSHSALQVSPVPYGMHSLIPNGRLFSILSCKLLHWSLLHLRSTSVSANESSTKNCGWIVLWIEITEIPG